MKNSKLGLLICQNYHKELNFVIKNNNYNDIITSVYAANCAVTNKIDCDNFNKILTNLKNKTTDIRIISPDYCTACQKNTESKKKDSVNSIINCTELFISKSFTNQLIAEGNYLITPGWLNGWKQLVQKRWGFDEKTAKLFFKESAKQITVLNTGVHSDFLKNISDFSDFTGLPFKILNIGIDYFRLNTEKIIDKWAVEQNKKKERIYKNEKNQKLANYVMLFDIIPQIASNTTEIQIIKSVFDLFTMLFSPKEIIFSLIKNDEINEIISSLPKKSYDADSFSELFNFPEAYKITESGKGLKIRVAYLNEIVAYIHIDNVMFPEHINSYFQVLNTINAFLGLFISNARQYNAVIEAKKKIEFSKLQLSKLNEELIMSKTKVDESEAKLKVQNEELEQKVQTRTLELQYQNIEYLTLNEEYLSQNEELRVSVERIEESEKKFKAFTNQSVEGITVADLAGNYVFLNPAFCEMSGYSEEELLELTVFDMKAKNQPQQSFYDSKEKMEGIPMRVNLQRKDGSEYLTEITGKTINIDNENLVLGTIRDITERVKKENEIIKLSTAVEQSGNTIVITDTEGNIEYTNPKFTELTGYSAQEAIGQNPKILNAGTQPKEYYTELWHTITKGKTWKGELHNKKKNGDYFWEQVTITSIKNEVGELTSYIAIKEDITLRKKGELEIIQKNKELIIAKNKAEESDQLKTEFINNMSHEIRTPLNGILGFSSILNKPNLADEKRKQYISIIQNSGNQLLHIIDDILEISKLGTKQVKTIEKEVCLNNILLELFSVFDIKAKESKIPLYLNRELSDNDSTILIDETKLNKILSNLLENALKYTDKGYIEFGYKIINKEIEIYVKDTGVGIKLENQEIIFERFSQEEKSLSQNIGGLGLGLSISKENTELLGGKITVQSEKGKGATFFVTIPYKPVNKQTLKNNSENEKGITTKKQYKFTILIVEDEEVNYLYIDTLLEDFELNLKTLHAKNGQEAVDICKNNNEIDFVLMDLKMPIMNGYEASKLIKKIRPDLPIVAQTAYSTQEEKKQALSAGCNYFISKPISKEIFNEIMKKYLVIKK